MDLDIEVSKLKLLKANHLSQKYALEDAISKGFPKQIAETQARIAGYGADIATVKENTQPNADGFSPLTLAGVTHADKKEAGAALLTMCQTMLSPEATQIGSYRGLTLELSFDTFAREYRLTMIGQLRHTVTLGTDVFGNLQRMDNALEGLPIKEQACREQLSNLQTQLETAKAEVQKPFPREAELNTKCTAGGIEFPAEFRPQGAGDRRRRAGRGSKAAGAPQTAVGAVKPIENGGNYGLSGKLVLYRAAA